MGARKARKRNVRRRTAAIVAAARRRTLPQAYGRRDDARPAGAEAAERTVIAVDDPPAPPIAGAHPPDARNTPLVDGVNYARDIAALWLLPMNIYAPKQSALAKTAIDVWAEAMRVLTALPAISAKQADARDGDTPANVPADTLR